MEIRIKIPYELSIYIERLFFEYNASCNLISYLLRQENINETYLNKYIKENENKYTELEIAKTKATDKYKPNSDKKFNYEFDFNNCEIIFVEK